MSRSIAKVLAGVPAVNMTLFHQIQFSVGDSAFFTQLLDGKTILLVRDIEMDRAKRLARADRIGCASDFTPEGGLDGDRDTALAQAGAECLRQAGVKEVLVDRTLPFLFANEIQKAGIQLKYDSNFGVLERRVKNEEELGHLREAQKITEGAMEMACSLIGSAPADAGGILQHDGMPLTSDRVRQLISRFVLDHDCTTLHDSIVVTIPHVADCHHFGTGPLRKDLPVIVDIFPTHNHTHYCGDCTRTVVNGDQSDVIRDMHACVLKAHQAGCEALRPETTGQAVHEAVVEVIRAGGYHMGQPPDDADEEYIGMRHGTGHGIGLDVHEPILLATGGGEILEREVFTVEPGLYSAKYGGVRVEDMVAVTAAGHENFNTLHSGLDWK
jgi:Xaa-Pro aminopeptidase